MSKPLDLDEHHAWRREHPTRPLPRDVEEALVAEVTQLRATAALMEHEARIRRELCDRFAGEVERERTAVVAYLRAESHAAGASPDEKRILTWVSGRIRGGEHRREEVK